MGRRLMVSERKVTTIDGQDTWVGAGGCMANDDAIVELVIGRNRFIFYRANAVGLREALDRAIRVSS